MPVQSFVKRDNINTAKYCKHDKSSLNIGRGIPQSSRCTLNWFLSIIQGTKKLYGIYKYKTDHF